MMVRQTRYARMRGHIFQRLANLARTAGLGPKISTMPRQIRPSRSRNNRINKIRIRCPASGRHNRHIQECAKDDRFPDRGRCGYIGPASILGLGGKYCGPNRQGTDAWTRAEAIVEVLSFFSSVGSDWTILGMARQSRW